MHKKIPIKKITTKATALGYLANEVEEVTQKLSKSFEPIDSSIGMMTRPFTELAESCQAVAAAVNTATLSVDGYYPDLIHSFAQYTAPSEPKKSFMYYSPKVVSLDRGTIDALAERMEARGVGRRSDVIEVIAPVTPAERFIEYRDNNFYANGKLIDFPDPGAIYTLVLSALYFESDPSGFASYETINKYITREAKFTIKSMGGSKCILNALTRLSRSRKRQKNALPKKTPDGQKIITIVPGKGLSFHNPRAK